MTLEETLEEIVRRVIREEVQAAMPPPPPSTEILAVSDVSRELGVCRKTIRSWISDGDLRAVRAGNAIRIRRSDLTAYLERAPKTNLPDAAKIVHMHRMRRKGIP